jgi:hypothetical protein
LKEQILHLDPHDDFISARDKMGWAQTGRILLVWPERGQVLDRRLDLLLLFRHANRLGAHLALITTDPGVLEHARELGVPTFPSIDASRQTVWRSRTKRLTPARRKPRPDEADLRPARSRWRLPELPAWAAWTSRGAVFMVGLAGLVALAYALVPGASINLTPKARNLVITVNVIADPVIQTIEGGHIPARTVRVEVEAAGRTPTTGVREVPSAPARGSVVFTSLDGTATNIPAGTGVRTTGGSPVRFRTTRAATLEPHIGAVTAVDVLAVAPGPRGNVRGGLINAIEGPLGLQLAVTNPAPMTGGDNAPQFAVTEADRERLHAELMTQLEAEGLAAIESQLVPGEFLASQSVRVTETVAETFEQAVGEPAELVALTLRIAISGLAIKEADARQVAQTALAELVQAREVLQPGNEHYQRSPELVVEDSGAVHFSVTAEGWAVPVVDRESVRQAVKGRTIPEAQFGLASVVPLSRTPDIAVWPQWLERLPWMPFRIEVVVHASEAG